jgi:mannose-6-phosphate isomerase-like protein (cupin superfamily)
MTPAMKASIKKFRPDSEFFTPEQCYIIELSNSADDAEVSIAQARVLPKVSTRWHRVIGTTERYLIMQGKGLVEVGDLPAQEVTVGDVVIIPASCAQRITNTADEDLVFLAICSPRFQQSAYEDIEAEIL